ncbi:MAG: phosphoribosylformylglycinamidine cyclo-ligase [Phycisphaerae bacterium]|nr:phosphoribosylformylglycinamidine cyclo-ligase [Phycisphaerae bacterium]
MAASPATRSDHAPGQGDGLTYAQSGVDIQAGDKVVDLIKATLRKTHGPRVLGPHGGFAGMFRLDFNEKLFKRNYRDPVLVACTDGVGTKVKLAAELEVFDTVGIDCVAMNVNDMIVQGAEPLFFLDYLGLHKTDPERTAQIISGVARGCEIAGCALIGGECAEMPDIYAEGDFDIAGFAVGVVELSRAIDPMRVEPDDVIIGLSSSGIHSNGYTLVRKVMEVAGLDPSSTHEQIGAGTLGSILLEPTRIYSRTIVQLLSGYKKKRVISGMAHITGGGIAGNLARALPGDVDAEIDMASWQVPPLFGFLQDHGRIDREEMYNVFNMGIGYTIIARPAFVDSIMKKLVRLGETPTIIGRITSGTGEVRLEDRS